MTNPTTPPVPDATVVLWRHGETPWNRQHRFQGCNADLPLTEQGLAQASAAAAAVATWAPELIVSSPLIRATQTAAAVEARLGLTAHRDERLREIDVGAWAGLTGDEAMAADPGYHQARRDGHDYRMGTTGETMAELGQRVAQALDDWAGHGGTILVVSHGWAIRAGVAHLLGWDYAAALGLRGMDNGALSVISRTGRRWRLDRWNLNS
jgi:probable phosphoglycerate mutase